MSGSDLFERILNPVGQALSQEAAQRLIGLRADPDMQDRIDRLADRANEGILSAEERGEYESLIAASTVIAILKTKSRELLARLPAA